MFVFLVLHQQKFENQVKVNKPRKKNWNSQFFQKTNETREKIILRALSSLLFVFFGRIDNFQNCFRILLTFSNATDNATLRSAWERVHGEIRHIRHMSCYLDGKDLWLRCRVGNLLVAEFPSSLGLNDVGVF